MGRTKTVEKEYAERLFVTDRLTAKEVAERAGVSERQVGIWRKNGNWDKKRESMLVTKGNQITRLYSILELLTSEIEKREVPVPTPKEADTISKITSSIQRLETETSIGQITEVATAFISFVREVDLTKAKDITNLFDAFIKSKM